MASLTYYPGTTAVLPPDQSFDITSIVAKRVGPYVQYYSFDTDGTMFVLRAGAVPGAGGLPEMHILGWSHFNGADLLQEATADLPLQPFLDIMGSRNPSSTKAFNWLMASDDSATGSARADLIHTLGGNDTVSGLGGNDRISAGAGNDLVDGGQGRDALNGGAGDDTLIGGAGADRLTGGAGADVFLFRAPSDGGDRIADFAAGDRVALDLAGFGLTGAPVFGAGPGPSLTYDQASGILSFDPDGTGPAAAVTLATLTNHAALSATDLVFV